MIAIWEPRWHDRKVLIAKYKVKTGENDLIFTKAKCLQGKTYKVHSRDIVDCPIETNGTIPCYAVPLSVVLGETKEKNRTQKYK